MSAKGEKISGKQSAIYRQSCERFGLADPLSSMAERTPLNGSKNHKAGVLLVIDAQRCCEDNSKLCTMQGTIYGKESSGKGRNSSEAYGHLAIGETLPRNSQKAFSLTYDSEVIIPIAESFVAKDNRNSTKENAKRKESKELASIEEAYYQNKLRKYHDVRGNRSTYKLGDFVLLSLSDTEIP
ncbi:hypothetical protein Tco_1014497 [Tanacetum coccineum]